jgi:hypothetical protein
MSDSRDRLPELDVSAALAIERDRPGLDAATRARALRRLRESITLGIGPDSTPPHDPPGQPSPDASAERPSAVRSKGTLANGLRRLPRAVLGVGCFLLGVGAGAGMHAALQTRGRTADSSMATGPRSPGTPTDSPPAPAAPYAETRSSPTSPALVGPDERATERAKPERRREEPSAPLPTGTGLAAERALLDVARSAYARGEPREALQALDRHARQFPQGTFNEEHEALAIKCLRALGRNEEARQRTASFKARYPSSLFISTIDEPVESNP